MHEIFRKIAHWCSEKLGSPIAFALALTLILAWAVSGPFLDFSTTWQLLINTGTTILTFLMVFVIQNTQNRDAKAMHLKLDELIKAMTNARNEMIDLEDMSDEELDRLQKEFQRVRETRTR
jgi:low affinity Fe/Cu permease